MAQGVLELKESHIVDNQTDMAIQVNIVNVARGGSHWTVNYTLTQSFITKLSNSLAEKH